MVEIITSANCTQIFQICITVKDRPAIEQVEQHV
jgi:hypothetical protein